MFTVNYFYNFKYNTREKIFVYISIQSKKFCLALLIVSSEPILIFLTRLYFLHINYENYKVDDDDDVEMHHPLLMQKADTSVTAVTSLISLSTSQSRTTHTLTHTLTASSRVK